LLIPCLNEGKVIAATVKNLLSLKMPNTKVVVINDGSTDNTLEILNGIKSRHLIILNRVYPNARQGKGQALNYAYRCVKGMIEAQDTNRHETNMQATVRCLLAGLLIPIYNMLQSPAVLIAIFRQAIGNNAWIKTDRV